MSEAMLAVRDRVRPLVLLLHAVRTSARRLGDRDAAWKQLAEADQEERMVWTLKKSMWARSRPIDCGAPVLVQRESRILLAWLTGYHVTDRPPNLQYDLGKDVALHVATRRAGFEAEYFCVQTVDFVAEQNAVVIDPPRPSAETRASVRGSPETTPERQRWRQSAGRALVLSALLPSDPR